MENPDDNNQVYKMAKGAIREVEEKHPLYTIEPSEIVSKGMNGEIDKITVTTRASELTTVLHLTINIKVAERYGTPSDWIHYCKISGHELI